MHTDSHTYPEYRAYVGRPEAFDTLGASNFTLLTMLGLREYHRLLDFGCGSLRSGRMFIAYLLPGKYFGIEPNKWLVDEAVKNELGLDILRVKKPSFDYNADFVLDVFGVKFDFIHAHSIFTHSPERMINKFFDQATKVMAPESIFVGTFREGASNYAGSEWVYPGQVTYTRQHMSGIVERHGFYFYPISWPHPEQTYFLAVWHNRNIGRLFNRILSEHRIDLREHAGPSTKILKSLGMRLRSWKQL